ncbi:MAG: hypothetical protein Pg6A_19650 [Termitinemataceae bacterium]|nr:MAG: hypothetical protein Pg6A_19650 [Termitinemataceae bacterium]
MKNKVLLFVLFVTLCVGVYAQENEVSFEKIGEYFTGWVYYKPASMRVRPTYDAFIKRIVERGRELGYSNVHIDDVTDWPTTAKKKASRDMYWVLHNGLKDIAVRYGSYVTWYDIENTSTFALYTSDNKWYILWVTYYYE